MLLLHPFHVWENRTCPRQAGSESVPGFNPRQCKFRVQPLNHCILLLFIQLYSCQMQDILYSGTTIHVLNCTDLHLCIGKPPGLSYPLPTLYTHRQTRWARRVRGCFIHLPPPRLHLNHLEESDKKSNITIYFMGLFLYLTTLPVVRLQAVGGQRTFLLSFHSSNPQS